MALTLYAHPFSSYCWKVLIALYENATPFEYRILDNDHPQHMEQLAARWPFRKFPVLFDDDTAISEATIIVEYLQLHHAGPVRLLPDDPAAALDVRFMDRLFDNYVSTPQQKLVADALRPVEDRDPYGVANARCELDTVYEWLDRKMQGHDWAVGNTFSMADCGAAPFLFYADWSHRIDEKFRSLHAYRQRLLARPAVARAVDEARPYRPFFPLGAPDRD